MTTEELIAKIKAEIDKLYGEYKDKFHQSGDQYHLGLIDGLDMAERVLSTLESEKPVPADLEEAAGEYEKKHTYQRYDGGGLTPEYDATLAEAFIAGYNLCKEQMMKEAEKPCHTVDEWIDHIKNADQLTKDIFSKGPYDVLYDALNHPYQHCYDAIKEFGELCYQTARQDMLKEAVEGEIQMRYSGCLCAKTIHAINEDKFKLGDKVRIIIIKDNGKSD